MFAFLLLYLCAYSVSNVYVSGRSSSLRTRCPAPEEIPNGNHRSKRPNVMRVTCNPGYFLQGQRNIECIHGKWDGERPVCAKKGCQTKPPNPTNGFVEIENEVRAKLFCNGNYKLAGNRVTYCNGTSWDRQLGNCRENKNALEYECDFETEDLCGWAYEAETETGRLAWRRVMAANMFTSFLTGPRHDHTHLYHAAGGHYMLMESLGSNGDEKIALMSPIYSQSLSLKTACCFRFYYFMYGASVGTLNVFVRPVTITLEQTMDQEETYKKFSKIGSQNNLWNEAIFNIEEMSSDFQIIFVASSGKTHLSDIAIDDVKLMTGSECKNELSTNSNLWPKDVMDITTSTEAVLYDTQSCVSRCDEKTPSGYGIMKKNDKMFGLCDCHFLCEESESCCPDYRAVCLDFEDVKSTTLNENIINEELTTTAAVDNTNRETTEISTTTTKKKPKIITTPTTPATTSTTVKATPTTITTSTKLQVPITTTTSTTVKSTQTIIEKTETSTKITTRNTTTLPTPTIRTYVTHRITTRLATPSATTIPTSTATTTTTTTLATPTTTRAQTTSFIDNKTNKNQKKDLTTISPVKKIPTKVPEQKQSQKPQHHGANVLLILFIILGSVLLLGATWMRCKYRLKICLQQFRGQPKDTELLPNAHTPSAVFAAKFNPTASTEPIDFIENCASDVSKNSSVATNNSDPNTTNRTNSVNIRGTTRKSSSKVPKHQTPLSWEDDNASENENNYADTALLQKR